MVVNNELYETHKYDDSNQLLSIFKENQEEFEQIVEIMKKYPISDYLLDEVGDPTLNNYTLKKIRGDSVLTHKDFDTVVDFMNRFGVIQIEVEDLYDYKFDFYTKQCWVIVHCLCIDNYEDLEEKVDRLEGLSDGEVLHISDEWYFVIIPLD